MMIDSTYDLNSHTLSLPLLLPPSLVDSPPFSHPPSHPHSLTLRVKSNLA